jgi:hypothetical protein
MFRLIQHWHSDLAFSIEMYHSHSHNEIPQKFHMATQEASISDQQLPINSIPASAALTMSQLLVDPR